MKLIGKVTYSPKSRSFSKIFLSPTPTFESLLALPHPPYGQMREKSLARCGQAINSSPVGRACLRILDLACRSKFRSVPLTRSNTNRLRVMDLPNEVTSEPGPTHA